MLLNQTVLSVDRDGDRQILDRYGQVFKQADHVSSGGQDDLPESGCCSKPAPLSQVAHFYVGVLSESAAYYTVADEFNDGCQLPGGSENVVGIFLVPVLCVAEFPIAIYIYRGEKYGSFENEVACFVWYGIPAEHDMEVRSR